MKYLKTYKLYESEAVTADEEVVISDIKNCFLEVSDMIEHSDNYGVRVREFSKGRGKVLRGLHIKSDYEVMIIPVIEPIIEPMTNDNTYRKTNMSNDMIQEIENSISLTKTFDLKFRFAAVECINAFDHSKGEFGPGSFIKKFSPDGVTPTSDKFEKGSYNLDYLFDFLRLKGDKVRWVKLFFDK